MILRKRVVRVVVADQSLNVHHQSLNVHDQGLNVHHQRRRRKSRIAILSESTDRSACKRSAVTVRTIQRNRAVIDHKGETHMSHPQVITLVRSWIESLVGKGRQRIGHCAYQNHEVAVKSRRTCLKYHNDVVRSPSIITIYSSTGHGLVEMYAIYYCINFFIDD